MNFEAFNGSYNIKKTNPKTMAKEIFLETGAWIGARLK